MITTSFPSHQKRDDLADYIADNYGTCARGADCYWGVNGAGAAGHARTGSRLRRAIGRN
jgi:hypothetical protein